MRARRRSQAAELDRWRLHVPTDPGANQATKCGMLLKLDGAKWVKVVPTTSELFDCNDKYLVTGDLDDGSNRVEARSPSPSPHQFGSVTGSLTRSEGPT